MKTSPNPIRAIRTLLLLVPCAAAALLAGCAGPGGPAQQVGRTVDHGFHAVGHGIESTGRTISNAAQ